MMAVRTVSVSWPAAVLVSAVIVAFGWEMHPPAAHYDLTLDLPETGQHEGTNSSQSREEDDDDVTKPSDGSGDEDDDSSGGGRGTLPAPEKENDDPTPA